MDNYRIGAPSRPLYFPFAIALFLAAAVLSMIPGCGTSALPPPVSVTIRDSLLIGNSKVIQISNNSSHHLYNVRVVVRNMQKVSSGSVRATDELRPGQTVEVGWMEFENWSPSSGEYVEVYCDNYVSPQIKIIP